MVERKRSNGFKTPMGVREGGTLGGNWKSEIADRQTVTLSAEEATRSTSHWGKNAQLNDREK